MRLPPREADLFNLQCFLVYVHKTGELFISHHEAMFGCAVEVFGCAFADLSYQMGSLNPIRLEKYLGAMEPLAKLPS
jgi:hypothetical protein